MKTFSILATAFCSNFIMHGAMAQQPAAETPPAPYTCGEVSTTTGPTTLRNKCDFFIVVRWKHGNEVGVTFLEPKESKTSSIYWTDENRKVEIIGECHKSSNVMSIEACPTTFIP